MTTALIANGDLSPSLKPSILRHNRIVAIDGGLSHCHHLGIVPHFLVGDFDSCPPSILEQYPNIPRVSLEKDKDRTDLEVAIEEELKRGAKKLILYGGWGGRIDHSLTNALLLARYQGHLQMQTEKELLFAIEKEIQLDVSIGQIISLIPLTGPVEGINTSGLKWNLKEGKLDVHFIGISNLSSASQVKISIRKGQLICCLHTLGLNI